MNRLVPSSKLPVDLSLEGYVPGPSASPDGTASIGDLWRILRRRRLLVVATMAVLFLFTLIYCLVAPPRFTATAELFIDPRDRQVVANDVNPSSMAPDGGITQVESQARVIGSSSVLLRAIKASGFRSDGSHPGLLGSLEALLSGPPQPKPPAMALEDTLNLLKRNLSITRADRVFVVDVSVSAPSAEQAARLANAVPDAYLADQAAVRARAGDQAAGALTERLAAQRARVEADANAIEAYKRTHNIVAADGTLVGDRTLLDLNSQLLAAQSRTAELKTKIDQIREARRSHRFNEATAEALQSPVIAKLREQESTLVERQAQLATTVGRRYPAAAAVRSQLANLHRLIAAELNRIAGATQADYQRAVSDQQVLAAQVQQAKAASQAVGQASVRLHELERDLDADRTVYAQFLLRAQEIREQAGIDTTNARVISSALPPEKKSWPPVGILLVGAIGSGFGLGSGLALMREYARPTILSAGQIERVIGAPVIAVLPGGLGAFARKRRWLRLGRRKRGVPRNRVLAMAGLALRRLYPVVSSDHESSAVRSIVLTSEAADLEARRGVCELFAGAARLRGERVLLIDADLEDGPEQGQAGLADVLRGEASLETIVARPDARPGSRSDSRNVATLGKGSDPAAVSGDISWSGARQLLADARRHFDLLVIDGGVLHENLSIAPLLAAAGEVILVGQLARTTVFEATSTAETAAILGRSITAVVLVDPMASV
jgi:uncharacterized protein involved in exopolysaccharide biosynthesis/Mrp family chromosome partitioning ATPase